MSLFSVLFGGNWLGRDPVFCHRFLSGDYVCNATSNSFGVWVLKIYGSFCFKVFEDSKQQVCLLQ